MTESEIRVHVQRAAQICAGLACSLLNLGQDGDEEPENLVHTVDDFLDEISDLVEALNGLAPSFTPLRRQLLEAVQAWDAQTSRAQARRAWEAGA